VNTKAVNALVSPTPDSDELAAIVAAVEALWPRPMIAPESQNPLRTPTWRFSGRWWATPLPARRARPFR
jgi:hypothetical protein